MTSTSLTVAWQRPEVVRGMLTSYTVHYTNDQGVSQQRTAARTSLAVTIDGLQAYTVYRVSVTASTDAGASVNSAEVTARTSEGGKLRVFGESLFFSLWAVEISAKSVRPKDRTRP